MVRVVKRKNELYGTNREEFDVEEEDRKMMAD